MNKVTTILDKSIFSVIFFDIFLILFLWIDIKIIDINTFI